MGDLLSNTAKPVSSKDQNIIFKHLIGGLTEDESPRKVATLAHRQSERLSLYHEYAQLLVDKGYAFCLKRRRSEERLF
jgi:glutamyl/glutaminyl-tRNA synthetase